MAGSLGDFPLPPTYPAESHARLLKTAAKYFEKSAVDQGLQDEFWAAWNAVAYRFASCAETAEAFASLAQQHGAAPEQPHRYAQEREFFHFVLDAMASLEALHYGVHAWGACRGLQGFLLSSDRDRRRAVPAATLIAVQGNAEGQALAGELKKIQDAASHSELDDIRRVLFHRGLPGRNVVVGGPSSYKPFAGTAGPEISPATTRSRLAWVGDCLAATIPRVEEWIVRTA